MRFTRLRARGFILMFRQRSPELDGTWTVGSGRDPDSSYRVNLNSDGAFCACPDSTRHPCEECKHSLAAVMLSRALVGLERHRVFDEVEPVRPAGLGDRRRLGLPAREGRLRPPRPGQAGHSWNAVIRRCCWASIPVSQT